MAEKCFFTFRKISPFFNFPPSLKHFNLDETGTFLEFFLPIYTKEVPIKNELNMFVNLQDN